MFFKSKKVGIRMRIKIEKVRRERKEKKRKNEQIIAWISVESSDLCVLSHPNPQLPHKLYTKSEILIKKKEGEGKESTL
jgi:hypothetical protein